MGLWTEKWCSKLWGRRSGIKKKTTIFWKIRVKPGPTESKGSPGYKLHPFPAFWWKIGQHLLPVKRQACVSNFSGFSSAYLCAPGPWVAGEGKFRQMESGPMGPAPCRYPEPSETVLSLSMTESHQKLLRGTYGSDLESSRIDVSVKNRLGQGIAGAVIQLEASVAWT